MSDSQPPGGHPSSVPPTGEAPTVPPQQGSPQVSTPPPHPYAAQGRNGMLGILGMAFGLLGALTAIITGLYFTGFLAVFPGLILGVAGISLGSVALGLRIRPMYAAIVGIFAGLLAVAVSIMFFAFSSSPAQLPEATDAPSATEGTEDAPQGESAPEGAPIVEWPANFATGGMIFDETLTPVESPALADGAAPEERTIGPDDPADIQLYVDYRCPVCAIFEAANAETLEEAVESGEATLEVRPLRFLDRVDEADQYSSRASSAVMCVASEQPEAAWDTHAHLLDQSVQPSESSASLSSTELADEIDAVSGGLNSEARSCIESDRFVPFAQALDSWVFSTPVPRAEDPELRVQGTPFAVVNGVPYTGSPDDADSFRAFLADQGIALNG